MSAALPNIPAIGESIPADPEPLPYSSTGVSGMEIHARPTGLRNSAIEMTRFGAHNRYVLELGIGAAMPWKVAEAKQKFSDLVRQAAREPQLIFNRERLVAAVIDGETFRAFQAWREQEGRKTVGLAFGDLRHMIEEEGYEFEIPARQDRSNAFLETFDDLSG